MKVPVRILFCVLALAAAGAACVRYRHSARIDALMASVPDKERKQALAEVGELYAKARFHQGGLEDAAEIIALSGKNLDALSYAAELVSEVGFHTATILSVAAEASGAKLELPEFRDLVELAVLKGGGHDVLVDEARWAAGIESAEEVAELRLKIAAMREQADWKTVDEAVAKTDEQQLEIERTIRERLRRTR
jgi:hypothetical protein